MTRGCVAQNNLSADERTALANAAAYASRGVYLVAFRDTDAQSIDEAKRQVERRLGDSPHLIDAKYVEEQGSVTVLAVVRCSLGVKSLVDNLQADLTLQIFVADLLTPEMIDQAENSVVDEFAKHLPHSQ